MSNSVGRNDNFLAKARKLSILPTSLDIFDTQLGEMIIFSPRLENYQFYQPR